MPRHFLIAILAISYVTSFCQSPKVARYPSEAVALLAKTKALYDTPFRAGLINFDCAIDFDFDQHLVGGVVDTSQHIEITTKFVSTPNGLVLAASSTDTNHIGVARFTYTYQVVDGFQLPQSIGLTSEQNKMTLNYTLTDCKVQHGIVVHVAPSTKP
jgi:hypothetical protein